MPMQSTTADTTPARDATVRERPILFSGPMVRALLDGSKTQTRRVVKGIALDWLAPGMFSPAYVALPENGLSPYGFAGDRLWVRERHALVADAFQITPGVAYHADGAIRWGVEMADGLTVFNVEKPDGWKWRPSIHTRREHSRILIELTDVRVERAQDISEADAQAEGAPSDTSDLAGYTPHVSGFAHLWQTINGARGHGWNVNPWVWVLSFRRVDA